MDDTRNIEFSYEQIPICLAFSNDESRVRLIIGPVGSGKSSACVMEILYRAIHQKPSPDGVRRSRWAVVRNHFPELRSTTIKTFHDWIPPRIFGEYKETKHEYWITNIPFSDGSKLECEIIYIALDDAADVAKLLSLELTGAWLNEVREIPQIIFDTIETRCGRYPSMKDGGCSWYGLIADTNAPDTTHWIYKLEQKLLVDPLMQTKYAIYHQPSGISEEAENIPNLRPNYYKEIAIGKDAEWIQVYVEGKYGYLRDGKPIFTNYNDALHTAQSTIPVDKSLPLILGFDFGLNATCVMAQYTNLGRLNILDEYVGEDIAIRRLIQEVVKPVLFSKYRNLPLIITGDPAGNKRSDTDEKSCFKEMKENGLPINAVARSNSWMPRFMAVDSLLTRMLGDGKPALQVSPNCETIRRGFISHYKRKRIGLVGSDLYREVAEKTIESHPMDCVQYISMVCEDGFNIQKKNEHRRTSKPKSKHNSMKAYI